MKKMVIFDFDGVIINTFSLAYGIRNKRFPFPEDEYRSWFNGNVGKALKKVEPQPDFFDQYTEELLRRAPETDIEEVIKQLVDKYTLIIVSSTITSSIRLFLDKFDLTKYFAEILGLDIEMSKEKKLQDVLERHKLTPLDTVFITDTLGDIKEAKKCDIKSIAVTWGYHPTETLKEGRPYKIVNKPLEILGVVDNLLG